MRYVVWCEECREYRLVHAGLVRCSVCEGQRLRWCNSA
jgi:Zn finger protein HypA/HybF involved in hydrogenase expression